MPSAVFARPANSSSMRPVPVPISMSWPIGASPSTADMAASTSLSAMWSERIASHCPALASNQPAAEEARSARTAASRAASATAQ